MHRHGYKGTKFGRERDQRRALIKSLAESLILNESLQTTLPKAKAVVSYTEKLITKAKKGDLHSRRQVISSLLTLESAHKLVDEISPKLGKRNSGYFKIVRTDTRRGDQAQLAKVTFVDDLTGKQPSEKPAQPKAPAKTERPTAEEAEKEAGEAARPEVEKQIQPHAPQIKEAPKRAGRRGNR